MMDDSLMISGIQHFAFCPRQWALIHIEQLWDDNVRTVDGQIFHRGAHLGERHEQRCDVLITRGLHIHSNRLGINGICDIVEFQRVENGFPLNNHNGLWKAYPIEYKKGRSKVSNADRIQLCAQAICLEEMLFCKIDEGAIFYGETRRRERVPITDALRIETENLIKKMHCIFDRGITPKANKTKSCKACSMINLCMPELSNVQPVSNYIKTNLEDVT